MTAGASPPEMAVDYLFELEIWLKSIDGFFVLEHLPMSFDQRSQVALRNYSAELAAVRAALGHISNLCNQLLGEERRDLSSFLAFLGQEFGEDRHDQESGGASSEQEMAFAIDRTQDLVRVFDEVIRAAFIPLPTFRSSGHVIVGSLRSLPALQPFFSDRLRPPLDQENRHKLQRIVERIAGTSYRKELVGLLMELFRELRAVEFARVTLERPEDAKRAILIFAFVQSQTQRFCLYLKKRLLPQLPEESAFGECLERILFATDMELRKVHEMILVDVLLLTDPRTLVARFEDAHGILRDLFQQNIIQLTAMFTDGVEAVELFPDHVTKLDQSRRLRDDLWSLVQRCDRFQEREDRFSLADMLSTLDEFKRGSMRFLMFKDWSNFDRYLQDFSREASMKTLVRLSRQFNIYLRTLLREVSKRSVLANQPFTPDPRDPNVDTQKIRTGG